MKKGNKIALIVFIIATILLIVAVITINYIHTNYIQEKIPNETKYIDLSNNEKMDKISERFNENEGTIKLSKELKFENSETLNSVIDKNDLTVTFSNLNNDDVNAAYNLLETISKLIGNPVTLKDVVSFSESAEYVYEDDGMSISVDSNNIVTLKINLDKEIEFVESLD